MSEITIRTARLDDASKLVSIYRYYVEKTAITFEYEVPTVAEFRRHGNYDAEVSVSGD